MREAALAALIVASLLPGAAYAGWRTDRAQTIAATVWHNPCDTSVTIRWAPQPRVGALAWSFPEACTIYLASDRPQSWPELCTSMIHEYGHLAGYRDPANPTDPTHSANPGSVMRATTDYQLGQVTIRGRTITTVAVGADRRCHDRGRPYLHMRRGNYAWS